MEQKLAKFNPEKLFDMSNKVVLIWGGAGKMGQSFAKILSNAGARVYIIDKNKTYVNEVASHLRNEVKNTISGISCDVTKTEQIDVCFEKIVEKEKKIDVMIYNVYSKPKNYYARFEDYSPETWDFVTKTNVKGAFICSKKAVSIFKSKKISGSIILTLSTYGIVSPDLRIYEDLDTNKNIYSSEAPLTTPLIYSVSKSGLLGMVKWLAGAYGKYGIRINGLTPGGVYDGQEKKFVDAYESRTPLGRMANWTDYNGAILFLASDASEYMTGANLVVDGGWTTW